MRSVVCAAGVASSFVPCVRDRSLRSLLGLVVLVNGLLCHLGGTAAARARDVATNAVLIAWVNATTAWRPTHALTAVAVMGWWANRANSEPYASPLHVLLVQLPLAIALHHY